MLTLLLTLPVIGLVLKATLLLTLAFLANLALRRSSAALRNLIWAGALGGVLMLPLLSVSLPHWSLNLPNRVKRTHSVSEPKQSALLLPQPVRATPSLPPRIIAATVPTYSRRAPSQPQTEASVVPPQLTNSLQPEHVDRVIGTSPKTATPQRGRRNGASLQWNILLAVCWVTGATFVLVQLVVGLVRVQQEKARSVRVSERVQQIALSSCERVGCRRAVTVLQSTSPSGVDVPVTWGIFRPTILLPRESDAWSDACLRAALLHEMAHIRRIDWAVQIMANLACAAYWFNPLVWIAVRHLRAESERACDDAVLRSGIAAADYADQLVHVARCVPAKSRRVYAATAMAAHPAEIVGRVRDVLASGRSRKPLSRELVAAAALVVLAATLPLAAARLKAEPTAASMAQPQGLDTLKLSGDYTLVYDCTVTDTRTEALKRRDFDRGQADYLKSLQAGATPIQNFPYAGTFAHYEALTAQPQRCRLTLSERGNLLLMRMAVLSGMGAGCEAVANRYNGRNTTVIFPNGIEGVSTPGFLLMYNCPLPGVGLSNLPILKNPKVVGSSGETQTWQAECVIHNATWAHRQEVYDPGTVQAQRESAAWKLISTDAPDETQQFSNSCLLNGAYVAGRVTTTQYTYDDALKALVPKFASVDESQQWAARHAALLNAHRAPRMVCEYHLVSASNQPLPVINFGRSVAAAATIQSFAPTTLPVTVVPAGATVARFPGSISVKVAAISDPHAPQIGWWDVSGKPLKSAAFAWPDPIQQPHPDDTVVRRVELRVTQPGMVSWNSMQHILTPEVHLAFRPGGSLLSEYFAGLVWYSVGGTQGNDPQATCWNDADTVAVPNCQ